MCAPRLVSTMKKNDSRRNKKGDRHRTASKTANMVNRLKSVETWDDKGSDFYDTLDRMHAHERDYSIRWGGRCLPMFHPKNKWRRRWDIMGMLFIIYNAIYLPQDLVFIDLQGVEGSQKPDTSIINHIADAFFIVDVLVTFRTGVETMVHGVEFVNMDNQVIAAKYIKGWLTIDILSIGIPFGLDQFLPPSWAAVIGVLALLKFFRLARLGRLGSRLVKIEVKYKQMARILVLITLYIFVNYLIGSLLYWIGIEDHAFYDEMKSKLKDGETVETWANLHFTKKHDFQDRLVTNMYFAMTTSTSVGYGDLNGKNNIELVLLTFIFIMTMFVTSTITGSILTLLDRMGAAGQRHTGRQEAVEEFVSTYDIEENMADHIHSTIEYEWQLNKFFDTASVLKILPLHLQKDLLMEIHKTLLIRVPFFQDLDSRIMKEVVACLQGDLTLAGDTIIHEGAPATRMFFINVGSVNIMAPHALYSIGVLHQYSYFGEVGLLVTHGRHSTTVVSLTRCQLSTLSKENIRTLCQIFPEFRKSFREEALKRMKRTQTSLVKARPAKCSEHRLMVEIIKAHGVAHDDGAKTYAKLQLHVQDKLGNLKPFGTSHMTTKARGSSPEIKYICNMVFFCHADLEMSQIVLDITFWHTHSWRKDTYIGSARITPASAQPGKVNYEWHYLEDHRPVTEWDKLWHMVQEQGPVGKDEFDLGQVLVKMARHRDGSGEIARLRALQSLRELSMLEHELERLYGKLDPDDDTEKYHKNRQRSNTALNLMDDDGMVEFTDTVGGMPVAKAAYIVQKSVDSSQTLLDKARRLSETLMRIKAKQETEETLLERKEEL